MQIIRHSKGIKKPVQEKLDYKQAIKKIGYANLGEQQPILKKSLELNLSNYDFKSLYIYEQYNINRIKSQILESGL